MTIRSVVAVYGVRVGDNRPRRLGSGSLQIPQLVIVDPPLENELASDRPPWVLRVGIASIKDGQPFAEVREVLQVMESTEVDGDTIWGLELTERSESPVEFGSRTSRPAPRLDVQDLHQLRQVIRRPRVGPPRIGVDSRPESPPEPVIIVPAGLWCRLFPRASFCN